MAKGGDPIGVIFAGDPTKRVEAGAFIETPEPAEMAVDA